MKISHIDRTNYISQKLAEVRSHIKLCNDIGHYDANLFMEDLVLLLLNSAFGYQLENINHKVGKNNVQGIDLIDEANKICIQVSSRTDLEKIRHTLKSIVGTEALAGYRLIYFALTDKSINRKTDELSYGDNIFSFSIDYYDFSTILTLIKSNPAISGKVYHILKDWVGDTPIKTFDERYSIPAIENLEKYYLRTVSVPAENEYDTYFHKDQYPSDTLYNFVSGKVAGFEDKKLWLLVSAAQVGKSYETVNLFHQLQRDGMYYPILIKARNFNNEEDIVLPFYAPTHKMVLILDGFDELPENGRNSLYRLVERMTTNQPDLKIVITCRRNYVNLSMFPNFQRLNLDDLSIKEIREITEQNDIDFNSFSKELIRQHLWELVFIPFFLESLISIYKNYGCLPTNRLDIIGEIISQSYKTDDLVNPATNIPSETYGNSMLKEIAYVLQLSEQKELSETDLVHTFRYDRDKISRCLRFAIFKRSEDKKYSFTKNIFLNYFVVQTLLEKNADEILKLVVLRDAEYSCINPAWLDVFELLMASIDKHSDKYQHLVEWMSKHDQMGIINLDSQSLPKDIVISTFKGLLIKYKNLGISGPNDFNYKFHTRLANHCIYRNSLDLLLSEYASTRIGDGYGYLLSSTIAFIDSDIIQASDLYPKFVNTILDNIKKNAYSQNNRCLLYIPLENKIFHNSTTADFLVNLYKSSNISLLKEIFSLISKLDDVDSYINFISANLDDYNSYTDEMGVHHPVDDKPLDIIFSKIKDVSNMHIAMNCMVTRWIGDRGHTSNAEMAYKSLSNLLNVISQYIDENANLIELIEHSWRRILIKRVFTGKLLHKTFCAIKKIVVKSKSRDKLNLIVQNMKACLKKENCGLELRTYRAIISLYLSPNDVDQIASEMDISEDNSIILNWMKSGLNPNVDERMDFWLDTKFERYNYHKPIDWEKYENNSKQVLVKQELLISTISDLLEKCGDKPISLYLDELEDRDMPTNTYVYLFCKSIEDELKSEYNSTKLIARAECKHFYDRFRINIIACHNIFIALSAEQLKDLKDGLYEMLENANESMIIECLMVAMRYDIRLPENIIIENLKFAALKSDGFAQFDSEDNFFAYAIKYVERKKINCAIKALLDSFDINCDKQHILQLMTYAIKKGLFICLPQILAIICNPWFYYSNIIVDTLNSIGRRGILIIKDNFKSFPSKLQIYSLKYVIELDDMQEEIVSCMRKIRSNDSEEDSRMALFYLLSFGHEDSLIELLNICKFNPDFLGDVGHTPTLKYSSIGHLPTLIEIMRISSRFTAQFNQWPTQCIRAIKHIALSDDKNTDVVIDALRDLVSESSDFIWLNYQIESIQQGRLQHHSKSLSVKEAFKLAES